MCNLNSELKSLQRLYIFEQSVIVTTFVSVDYLLQNSEVQVIVYSGQYDVICATKGMVFSLTWW